jgi:hypothetical protein
MCYEKIKKFDNNLFSNEELKKYCNCINSKLSSEKIKKYTNKDKDTIKLKIKKCMIKTKTENSKRLTKKYSKKYSKRNNIKRHS